MEGYLNSHQDTEAIYYLNKVGRETVGAKKAVTRTAQTWHTLMRNDIYIHYHCPEVWANEFLINTPGLKFVADAVFLVEDQHYFLEVDNQQKMNANKDKLNNYFRFKSTELWQNKNNGSFPLILFYTLSATRKSQLQELNPGLDLKVLTKKDLL